MARLTLRAAAITLLTVTTPSLAQNTAATSSTTTTTTTTTISIPTPSTRPGACLDFSYDIDYSLTDSVQFPHLILPLSRTTPSTAPGTVYAPTLDAATTVLYAFDIPPGYAGCDCDLLFGLPETDQLAYSASYTESGGPLDIAVSELEDGDRIEWDETYDGVRAGLASALQLGSIQAHGTTNVTKEACRAGERVVYALEVPQGSNYSLTYFQDHGSCAIGLFVIPI